MTSWKQANARRGDLIEQKVRASLNKQEEKELAQLQTCADTYANKHAPLPIKALEKIKARLKRKRQWVGKE